jgi:hypothetical protein
MRCFYHGDVDAVAICKSCYRGICPDCCAEVGPAVGCRNRCESDVAAINDIILRNRTAYKKASSAYFWFGVGFSILGLLTVLGSLMTLRSEKPEYGGLIPGTIFVFLAGVFFVTARRFRAK